MVSKDKELLLVAKKLKKEQLEMKKKNQKYLSEKEAMKKYKHLM